jgi:hypothetical protein
MWCGGGHLHNECPEKGKTASIPTCCNCKQVDGEEPRPSNYRGCRHAKEDTRKRKLKKGSKSTPERVFSSSHTTPGPPRPTHSNRSSLSHPQPAALPPGKEPRYPLDRKLGGPQSRSGRHGKVKILAPTWSRTPTTLVVQPVVSRYTDCAIPALTMTETRLNFYILNLKLLLIPGSKGNREGGGSY